RDRRERDSYLLPDKILEDMEDTPKIELKDNIKKFQRRTVNYEGGNWTRSGRINKIFIANLKKFNLDAHTVILEKIPRLSVYEYISGKKMDEEARDISTKALRLPTSVRYLEDKDDEDKDMAFDNQDSLSQMFVVREKDKVRPILNCQRINQFIQCQHFKMESVPILRDLIEAGDWMCKIDLKDAYTMVPIHPESRQYLFF
ncbi:hypothetical protein BCV71DRAFT_169499, partial [Rhizopus microsporus]